MLLCKIARTSVACYPLFYLQQAASSVKLFGTWRIAERTADHLLITGEPAPRWRTTASASAARRTSSRSTPHPPLTLLAHIAPPRATLEQRRRAAILFHPEPQLSPPHPSSSPSRSPHPHPHPPTTGARLHDTHLSCGGPPASSTPTPMPNPSPSPAPAPNPRPDPHPHRSPLTFHPHPHPHPHRSPSPSPFTLTLTLTLILTLTLTLNPKPNPNPNQVAETKRAAAADADAYLKRQSRLAQAGQPRL